MVSPTVKQTWTISSVLMHMLGQGMSIGFTSILLKSVLDPDGDIKANLYEASWTVSVAGISCLPGFWAATFLMTSYGRRLSHAILLLPAIASWSCIYFGKTVTVLIIGRAVNGFCAGGLNMLECVVIGEYASPKNRGVFMALKTAAFCFGAMVSHILAHFCNWRIIGLICPIPFIFSLLMTFTWPESPSWLVLQKRYAEGKKSFYWLRGESNETRKEIDHLISAQMERASLQTKTPNFIENFKEFFMKFTKKDFIKPAIIILFSKILIEASAKDIFPSFAMQIIGEVTVNKSQILYYTFGIDIIITLSSVCAFIFFKLIKRRTLLFSTGFAAVFVLYTACFYLFLVDQGVLSNTRTYIPTLLFAIFLGLCNLACTHLPFLLMGEILPLAHRGAGVSFAGVIASICVFTSFKFTPYLLLHTKVYGTFTIFGTFMAMSLIVLWFILPETKDRTLQEIEDYFVHGNVNHKEINDEANLKMMSNENH